MVPRLAEFFPSAQETHDAQRVAQAVGLGGGASGEGGFQSALTLGERAFLERGADRGVGVGVSGSVGGG